MEDTKEIHWPLPVYSSASRYTSPNPAHLPHISTLPHGAYYPGYTCLLFKTDITGEHELNDAVLSIIDKEGHVVETWKSNGTPHYIERIPTGEYTLREERLSLEVTILPSTFTMSSAA